MNPDSLHEHLQEHLKGLYVKRNANPQEGDVVRDVYGTKVYLDGGWKDIDYTKPLEVDKLRQQWLDTTAKNMQVHQNTNFGRADLGKHFNGHLHVGKDPQDEKEYTEVELDNATLEAYTQGKQDFANELLQLLAAEEAELRSYGRTELYGIHKAVSVIRQALNNIHTESEGEDANVRTDSDN